MADARHAYAVLRGLTSASGAMVAAATTSLPERLEGSRNYDYRYAWIRDQCYAGLAVAAHGPHPLLTGAVRFVTERLLADGPDLMPGYTVSGRADPRASGRCGCAGSPAGPRGRGTGCAGSSSSTRWASRCRCSPPRRGHDMLDEEDWRAAAVAAEAIGKRWREPDAGIWELDNRRWAHSRLACVSGLRAIAAAAAAGPPGGHGQREAARWTALADAIMASLGDCVHPSGRLAAGAGRRAGGRRAAAADDPRRAAASTIRGTSRRSRRCGGSWPPTGTCTGSGTTTRPLDQAEGAFLLCGFWMALVEHARGDPVAAAHWFERNRGACGPAALYTEEYDVHQRQLRGNLPQAFVHAGRARMRGDAVPGRAARRRRRLAHPEADPGALSLFSAALTTENRDKSRSAGDRVRDRLQELSACSHGVTSSRCA